MLELHIHFLIPPILSVHSPPTADGEVEHQQRGGLSTHVLFSLWISTEQFLLKKFLHFITKLKTFQGISDIVPSQVDTCHSLPCLIGAQCYPYVRGMECCTMQYSEAANTSSACTRQCSKRFVCVNSLDPHNRYMRSFGSISFSFYTWGHWGPKRFNNLH